MTLTPSERAEVARQVHGADGADYDVFERHEWRSDTVLRRLALGLSYFDDESFFYFGGFSERQRANLQRIVLAISPSGTMDYRAVTPDGGTTGFLPVKPDVIGAAAIAADIWWFTPNDLRSEDWVALMPKGFDLDAADVQAHPSDGVRYFVCSADTQAVFLGLFALICRDDRPEMYQWDFPGWSRSHWSLDGLTQRSDAFLSEYSAHVIDEYYPGVTGCSVAEEVSI